MHGCVASLRCTIVCIWLVQHNCVSNQAHRLTDNNYCCTLWCLILRLTLMKCCSFLFITAVVVVLLWQQFSMTAEQKRPHLVFNPLRSTARVYVCACCSYCYAWLHLYFVLTIHHLRLKLSFAFFSPVNKGFIACSIICGLHWLSYALCIALLQEKQLKKSHNNGENRSIDIGN